MGIPLKKIQSILYFVFQLCQWHGSSNCIVILWVGQTAYAYAKYPAYVAEGAKTEVSNETHCTSATHLCEYLCISCFLFCFVMYLSIYFISFTFFQHHLEGLSLHVQHSPVFAHTVLVHCDKSIKTLSKQSCEKQSTPSLNFKLPTLNKNIIWSSSGSKTTYYIIKQKTRPKYSCFGSLRFMGIHAQLS